MPTIQMSHEEWTTFQASKQAVEAELAAVKAQLLVVATADERVAHLVEALREAREVVRFAVANMAPETVRGWPYASLTRFADLLETAPGACQDYKEMAIDLRDFARQAERLEEERKRRVSSATVASGAGGLTATVTLETTLDSTELSSRFGRSMPL